MEPISDAKLRLKEDREHAKGLLRAAGSNSLEAQYVNPIVSEMRRLGSTQNSIDSVVLEQVVKRRGIKAEIDTRTSKNSRPQIETRMNNGKKEKKETKPKTEKALARERSIANTQRNLSRNYGIEVTKKDATLLLNGMTTRTILNSKYKTKKNETVKRANEKSKHNKTAKVRLSELNKAEARYVFENALNIQNPSKDMMRKYKELKRSGMQNQNISMELISYVNKLKATRKRREKRELSEACRICEEEKAERRRARTAASSVASSSVMNNNNSRNNNNNNSNNSNNNSGLSIINENNNNSSLYDKSN
jgi:hypothetical protein